MTREEVYLQISTLLQNDIIRCELPHLEEDTELGENGLGLDSLRMLGFFTLVEKQCKILIDDEYWNLKKITTIGEMLDYIISKIL
mgnify:CR=1 FL=1